MFALPAAGSAAIGHLTTTTPSVPEPNGAVLLSLVVELEGGECEGPGTDWTIEGSGLRVAPFASGNVPATPEIDFTTDARAATYVQPSPLPSSTRSVTLPLRISPSSDWVLDDQACEPTETFGLQAQRCSDPSCIAVLCDQSGSFETIDIDLGGATTTIAILDNDGSTPETIEIAPATQEVAETGGEVALEIRRDVGEGTITVPFALQLGTAEAGDVVAPHDLAVTFASGELVKTVIFGIVADADTADETFAVELGDPIGDPNDPCVAPRLGNARAGVTIRDGSSSAPAFAFAFASEGGRGVEGTRVGLGLVRLGEARDAAVVTLGVAGGTASAADFTLVDREVRFAPHQREALARVDLRLDFVTEGSETAVFAILSTTGGEIDAPAQFRLEIADGGPAALALAISGDAHRSVEFGDQELFEVRASDGQGVPVAGVDVSWSLTGVAATLVDGATTRTGTDGVARQHVRAGGAIGSFQLAAQISGQPETRVDFSVDVDGEVLEPGIERPRGSAAAAVENLCRDATEFTTNPLCAYFRGLRDATAQRRALDEIAGHELASISGPSLAMARAGSEAVGRRLAALRGGAHGVAAPQLGLTIGGRTVPTDALAESLTADRSRHRAAAALERRIAALSTGGRGDSPAASAPASATEAAPPSRWGLFANGQLATGNGDATARETGFDFDSRGLTAGFDYRLDARWALGVALAWASTDADFDGGGKLANDGRGATLFALWQSPRAFYAQAIASRTTNSLDVARRLDLPGLDAQTARGSTDGRELTLGLEVGGSRDRGPLSATGFGRVLWTDATIDGYRERGSIAAVAIGDQSLRSFLAEAGVDCDWSFSTSWGVWGPSLSASVLHEFEDGARLVPVRLLDHAGAPAAAGAFVVPTDAPDRDFFTLGVGVQALTRAGTFYARYQSEVARRDLPTDTLSFGFRHEF